MKHILFLTWKDISHPNSWGAENVMYEYAKRLVNDGHKVTWFASSYSWAVSEENIDGIKVIRRYSIKTIYFFAWKWYAQWKKHNSPDIIIDEAWGIPLFSPFFEKKVPIYFFIHHIGDKEFDNALPFPLNQALKKVIYRIFKLYRNHPTITVSESTKQELLNDFWFSNVHVIENASSIKPIENLNFSQKKNEILFLWRLMPIKRVEESIKAFFLLQESSPNHSLNIIGNKQDPHYYKQLKKLITELQIESKVFFYDYSKQNVDKYLPQAKAMLVTSEKEGFWLVVTEANSYGVPVLWYNVPGIKDSIHEWINGHKIKDGATDMLWEKLKTLINNTDNLIELSNTSLIHVKTLGGWDQKYNQFKKIIF